jgi:UDP-glucose 4-epimerase
MNFSHIVFASSAAIYGDKSTRPHTESDPEVLDHPYARAKSEAENILRKESDTVVRLANVYGPGMAKNNIFSDILNQLSQDTEALFVRDGSSIRDFVHVDDVVDGFIRIAKAPQSGVFNLGSGVGTKAEDLGRLVLDVAGQKNRKVASLKLGDSGSCLVLDSSKMMKTYTWRPRKSLEEGIGEMLAAYQLRKQ